MASSDELVVLSGGVSVPMPAMRLALDLEERGFRLRAREDGRLEVQPCRDLTRDDITAIREHRDELLRIAQYVPPEVG